MDLDELLIAAAEAPPETRIEFRDQIAARGEPAIDRLMTAAWIGDPPYAGFAIQAIRRAGDLGANTHAILALQRALELDLSEWHRQDIERALASLGSTPRNRKPKQPRTPPLVTSPIAPEDLLVGRCYRRSELHDRGMGGNRQKGISYPARGTHCLLFSDPSKDREYGYRDRPDGENRYRYFGEWSGSGDMTMTAGNRAIVDRSPELYLFTAADCGHRYRGRFRLLSSEIEKSTRDGREFNAIVFNLERIDG